MGGLLDLWPPHGSALLQSLVCYNFNQTITPSKLTHTSFWWIVDTLGHSIFAGEASYVRVGGALPRWRLPLHSLLIASWSYVVCYGSKPRFDWIMIGIEIFVKCFWLPYCQIRIRVLALVICISRGSWSSILHGDFGHEHSIKIIVIFVWSWNKVVTLDPCMISWSCGFTLSLVISLSPCFFNYQIILHYIL